MDMFIDVYGPKIIIPEKDKGKQGFFVLDLGKVYIEGSMNSMVGCDMRLNITDLCACLTLVESEIHSYKEKELYLIYPIDAVAIFSAKGLWLGTIETVSETVAETGSETGFVQHGFVQGENVGGIDKGKSKIKKIKEVIETKEIVEKPDLGVDITLESKLKVNLNIIKLLQLVDHLKIFLLFLNNIYTVFILNFGNDDISIDNEQLAKSLSYLNNILNPTISNNNNNNNNSKSNNSIYSKNNKNSRSIENTHHKTKFTDQATNMFNRMMGKNTHIGDKNKTDKTEKNEKDYVNEKNDIGDGVKRQNPDGALIIPFEGGSEGVLEGRDLFVNLLLFC